MLLTFKPKFAPKQDFPEITAKSLNPLISLETRYWYMQSSSVALYIFFCWSNFFSNDRILKLTISSPLVREGRRDQSVTNLKTCMLSLSLSD